MDTETVTKLMDAFFNDPPEVFSSMLSDMSEADRAFFNGYVHGYTQGSLAAQAAIEEDSKKTTL